GFIVVDTGGFVPEHPTGIVRLMARQAEQAVAEADAVVFVVDLRAGVSAHDHDIARYLRSAGKRVVVAVNKAEGMADSALVAEFYELGLGDPHPISAAHGQGVVALAEAALAAAGVEEPVDDDDPVQDAADAPIRIAVAGRPNVGKSTLINAWLGEERLVAFDQPGTTRDAIVVPFTRGGQRFDLIDTAGLRRRGKVFEAVEKFSVVKTLQAIAEADVVLLLLDATQGVTDQDAHIAGYVVESGRSVVVAVNKWDAADGYQREIVQRSIEQRLPFLRFATVLTISAVRRQGFAAVWKAVGDAQDADAGADAPATGGRGAPGAQARRRVPPEVALRAPGRQQAAVDRHPRQLARARDRRLQALPGRALSRPFQARRHAAAHRAALRAQSVRGEGPVKHGLTPHCPDIPVIRSPAPEHITEHEREQQRAATTRPVPEPAAQGARSGFHLSRQRNQAAGTHRVVRPVRRSPAQHRHADGLQACDLDRRARPCGELPDPARSPRPPLRRGFSSTRWR